MRAKTAIALLCALTILSGTYAVRQRQWALKLRDQLSETNKDDVKLMRLLSDRERESICRRLRAQGEDHIADWITDNYPAAQTATSGPAGETADAP